MTRYAELGSGVLQAYLQADDPDSRESTLGELMETHAQPIIRRVVLARLAGSWDDIDDVCSEVRLELLLRLRRVKTDPMANAIADFPAYVAAVAANGCNRYFRRRRPGRARLKRQIRVLVSHEPQFRLESSPDGRVWCGLSERDRSALETSGTIQRIQASGHIDDIVSGIEAQHDLGRLVAEILEGAGTPLELDVLADVAARIWRIPEDAHRAGRNLPVESVPATFAEPELVIDRRRYTARLWEEIRQLPRSQRVALLLHLRDHGGNSVLFLFPLCGVASFEQIASTLEIKQDTLSEVWNRLPLDDLSISSLLSCARQQVINLRMSARKRLANRMRGLG